MLSTLLDKTVSLIQNVPESIESQIKSMWFNKILQNEGLWAYSIPLLQKVKAYNNQEGAVLLVLNDLIEGVNREQQVLLLVDILQVKRFVLENSFYMILLLYRLFQQLLRHTHYQLKPISLKTIPICLSRQ